mmetsp:Transcript_15972/g.45205  ORF Transcript_15972/g.45205 Transcript_15972/m.45205 type:complete len:169 (-) Transcript_15972:25-531(-)|eukprot:CAMPEP_0119133772 /NCGR_PEP_ID=MMETSP1310-20130426/13549_1 /TAXON_ID=464262 /ORGANISM="Genus nov. species nov., Strain RCC2339" /LENGTH=168 /DNA_ID=CAMNT_0007124475 /DNA_START=95 /DNA_END=601 /DNA_ORIENTATION=-
MSSDRIVQELQRIALPASIGTVSIVFSTIQGIMVVNDTRYKLKGFSHPYKPWEEEQSDEKTFRAFKANQNQVEWMMYVLPSLWIYSLYAPSIPKVGKYAPWVGASLAVIYGFYSVKYVKAYAESAEKRISPFHTRKNIFFTLLVGGMAGMVFSSLKQAGIALPAVLRD